MLSNPERHFLPSHYLRSGQKKLTSPSHHPKTVHPNTFSNTEPSTCNFHLRNFLRNLPLRTSKLKFHCWGRPINKETHKASLKAAWCFQHAGTTEICWPFLKFLPARPYFRNLCTTDMFALKHFIVGRQSCSLFGGSCLFSLGWSCCFREDNFPVCLFQQNPWTSSSRNVQKMFMASNLENKYPINNLLIQKRYFEQWVFNLCFLQNQLST